MAAPSLRPWLLLLSILLLSSSPSLSQSPPSNLQVFFPSIPSPAFPNSPPLSPPPPPIPPSPSQTPQPSKDNPSNTSGKVTTAVLSTAACSFAISGLLFFIFRKYTLNHRRQPPQPGPGFLRSKPEGGSLKGVVVDENGLDVLYWRKLDEDIDKRCDHCNRILTHLHTDVQHPGFTNDLSSQRNDRSFQEMPLLPSNSVNSSARIDDALDSRIPLRSTSMSYSALSLEARPRPSASRITQRPPRSPPKSTPPPPPPPPPLPPPPAAAPPPPPPPPPTLKAPSPPPPPPPRPPTAGIKNPAAPPPPPPGARLPPTPNRTTSGKAHPRLKPLHWDKMSPINPEHSMVWDKISGGSFRVDDDLMEALFGYVATNRKSPLGEKNTSNNTASSSSSSTAPRPTTQISLLDPRKSQNVAIILRTLTISRQDILDALLEGRGLSSDALEKLSRTAPTKEEENTILAFTGNPSKLADAESFLYHILRAVPSPFERLNAMLFKHNYEPEILHTKQSLQTLEFACKEMKTKGIFLKLLEAILKAGNRMNAGTARGNAQAFNLTALCKLSDVKSTDGKTTLLHFVVEEVVRSEGKRCVINRNQSMRRTNSISSNADSTRREEREREYMMLGLPVVGGLSVEFANVKKAAGIDYEALVNNCSSLGMRIKEIGGFLNSCDRDGFVREMEGFLEVADGELREVREEQGRVVELVNRTTEYYQVGASKEKGANPLKLFVIVREFLEMVDQTCVDITRNLQKKKQVVGVDSSSTSSGNGKRVPARFPNLPAHFMSDNSKSSDSDSEDGF